jgi:hypothetical protein
MNFDFLLIFFVARYLRTNLKTKEDAPDWDERLKWGMYLGMGLFIAALLLNKYTPVLMFVGELALSRIGLYLIQQQLI